MRKASFNYIIFNICNVHIISLPTFCVVACSVCFVYTMYICMYIYIPTQILVYIKVHFQLFMFWLKSEVHIKLRGIKARATHTHSFRPRRVLVHQVGRGRGTVIASITQQAFCLLYVCVCVCACECFVCLLVEREREALFVYNSIGQTSHFQVRLRETITNTK